MADLTGGLGADAVIDAVGMEARGFAVDNALDHAKQKFLPAMDRALRTAIMAVRKGGRASVPSDYGGFTDKFPLGGCNLPAVKPMCRPISGPC